MSNIFDEEDVAPRIDWKDEAIVDAEKATRPYRRLDLGKFLRPLTRGQLLQGLLEMRLSVHDVRRTMHQLLMGPAMNDVWVFGILYQTTQMIPVIPEEWQDVANAAYDQFRGFDEFAYGRNIAWLHITTDKSVPSRVKKRYDGTAAYHTT